jgi:hypothetical protein
MPEKGQWKWIVTDMADLYSDFKEGSATSFMEAAGSAFESIKATTKKQTPADERV